MTLYRYKGKLLRRNGKLAGHERCCCEPVPGSPCDCPGVDWPNTVVTIDVTNTSAYWWMEGTHETCSKPQNADIDYGHAELFRSVAEYVAHDDHFVVFRFIEHKTCWLDPFAADGSCVDAETIEASGECEIEGEENENRLRWNCQAKRWEVKGVHPNNVWTPFGVSNGLVVWHDGNLVCNPSDVTYHPCHGGTIDGEWVFVDSSSEWDQTLGRFHCDRARITVAEVTPP